MDREITSSDNDSSSDGDDMEVLPNKRLRLTSSTSQGFGVPEVPDSDEETSEVYTNTYLENTNNMKAALRIKKKDSEENGSITKSSDSLESEDEDSAQRPSFGTDSNKYDNANDNQYTQYSAFAKNIMSKMGHKSGEGLGKDGLGRVEPVQASTQMGRRGLGLKPSVVGAVPSDFKWSPDESRPEAKKDVMWMPTPPQDPITRDLLENWLTRGPKKLTIDDEDNFVDPSILKGILDSKTIFNTLDDADLRKARFRSNPYETIGSVIFLNRAAVKMANIDAEFDFMFTKPITQDGQSAIDKKEILYFADVCAGPGGFSEYVLYRRGWKAKGFGFTLKASNDFKLSDFYAGTSETFNPYYGVKDDGNVFDPDNLESLKERVLKHTDDKGVHFLMADGGFSVEGQENIQEILSKQLYLCQCLAALMLVRTGGHFVVKLFDVFTLFSVGLIYIMYRCFDRVCIYKPVTSRPANSERYLICKWKKLGTESAEAHLFYVNELLCRATDSNDVTELVPLSVIQEEEGFYEYMYKSNCLIGEGQIKNLLKIAAFSKDPNLKDHSQAEMREQCLKLWQIPDEVRKQPERKGPEDTMLLIAGAAGGARGVKAALNAAPTWLQSHSDLDLLSNIYDWHFVVLSSTKTHNDLKFFIGCGGKQVYQLDGSVWNNVIDITMPAKTLLYGEIVKEYQGEEKKQMFTKALHIVDAVMLGGRDISNLPLSERINQCSLFCNALEKPFDSQAMPLRTKRLFPMENFGNAAANFEYRLNKQRAKVIAMDTPNRNRDGKFYVVGSIMFLKELKEPWTARISKSSGKKYYHCSQNNKSVYFMDTEARLDTLKSFATRIMWNWETEEGRYIFDGLAKKSVSRPRMEEFISQKILSM